MIQKASLFNAIRLASIAALIAGCVPATPSDGDVQTAVAVTFAAMTIPVPTNSKPAASATTAPTEVVFTPYEVRTTTQNVNLRIGPGTLFQVSRVMAEGTTLEVTGQSRGSEWLYVRNDEGIFGWVGKYLVEGVREEPPAPLVEPEDVFLVTGAAHSELNVPVSGIGFALTQIGFSARRTDATTDNEGRFYAYIPSTLGGSWTVQYVSIACTSNTMDANCNCKSGRCGEADPASVEITIPFSGELNFVWK
jgi:SH3-like domain-containing protein